MTKSVDAQSKEFLKLVTPWDALAMFASVPCLGTEEVSSSRAVGRVAGRSVVVPQDYPPFDRATMDGYAVRSADVQVATSSSPVMLELVGEVTMARPFDGRVEPGQTVAIPTGAVMPQGADSVVMVEQSARLAGNLVELYRSAALGANVLHRGEDAAEGEVFIEAGHRISSAMVGALSGMGIAKVSVFRRPRVGVLATGDEIVASDQEPGPCQIRDVNGAALVAAAQSMGASVEWGGIVPDRLDDLVAAVGGLLERCDLVLLSGGSSVGVRDLTARALEGQGGDLLFHGVALKPGRPTLAARVGEKLVVGMPGHPVSSAVSFSLLVAPLLRKLEGEKIDLEGIESSTWPDWRLWPKRVQARLGRRTASVAGREHFVRVRFESAVTGSDEVVSLEGRDAGGRLPLAMPLPGDSAVLTSVVRADGFIRIPAGVEGLEAGRNVEVLLL